MKTLLRYDKTTKRILWFKSNHLKDQKQIVEQLRRCCNVENELFCPSDRGEASIFRECQGFFPESWPTLMNHCRNRQGESKEKKWSLSRILDVRLSLYMKHTDRKDHVFVVTWQYRHWTFNYDYLIQFNVEDFWVEFKLSNTGEMESE